jgi:hypothetical protein
VHRGSGWRKGRLRDVGFQNFITIQEQKEKIDDREEMRKGVAEQMVTAERRKGNDGSTEEREEEGEGGGFLHLAFM